MLRFAGLRDRMAIVSARPSRARSSPTRGRTGWRSSGSAPAAEEVAFVAAHWWDVAGAKRAGLRTGWVARRDLFLPDSVPEPDVRGRDLAEVAGGLARLAD